MPGSFRHTPESFIKQVMREDTHYGIAAESASKYLP
jgi:hypothetical protein